MKNIRVMMRMDTKTIKAGVLYRQAILENIKATSEEETKRQENRSFDISFSSEEPVEIIWH